MKKVLPLLIVLLLAILTACNSESQTGNSGSENGGGTEGDSQQRSEDTSGGEAITVEDMYGEKTFEEVPERIVVLEWVYAEDILALDVQPVGMADIEGYNNWVNIEKELSDEVEDVGTRQEPNLEAISALNPDVIITAGYRHEGIMDSLESIAPTLAFNPYPAEGEQNQYEEMISTFNTLGTLLDKEDQAQQVLDDMETTFSEVESEISDSDIENNSYVLSQAYSADESPVIRLFKDNAMVTQIIENIGLENAYESEEFQVYGFDETSVEALQTVQDAHFFYIVQEDDNIFDDQLAGNPAWENLNFVEEGKTYQLPGDTWTFGGPLSAKVFAEEIRDALLEQN